MRRAIVASSAVVLLAGACGGGADTSPSPATATRTSERNAPVDTSTLMSPERSPARPTYAYPAGGPADPMFPTEDDAYEMLSDGRCQDLLDASQTWGSEVEEQQGKNTIYLYRSAAEACLGRWSEAAAEFDRMSNPDFSDNCARNAVFEWLRRLIDARRADPGYSPIFVTSSDRSPCPTEDSTSDPTPEATATASGDASG